MHGVLAEGSNFAVYVVGAPIGEGGMARIYRAEHAGLRRQVALKVLINGFARDPEGRQRFVREARNAAAIKHPNVVNIFDVGVHEDIPYLVMELLEGTDLESLLVNKGALEESLIIDVMVPIVGGLTAVHDAGIVHRDLKPGNIFLAKGRYDDIEPKLLDFGISKVAGPDQLKLTTNGLLMGTPFYMSPEGLRGEEMTSRSDQYSLGVVMYECATGQAPFTASTLPELMRAIANGDYRPPNEVNPNVSKRLARIITRAMSLDPERRFADLREMGRELLSLAGQRTRITWGLSFGELPANDLSHPGTLAPMGASLPPEAAPPQRRKVVLALAAAIPVLLIGALLKFAGGDPPNNRTPASGSLATSAMLSGTAPRGADPTPVQAAPSSVEVLPLASATAKPSDRATAEHLLPRDRSIHQRRSVPASPGSTGDDTADWALPNTPASRAKSNDARTGLGSNGAPIFD